MKITITIEDTISVAGSSFDFGLEIDPPLPENPTDEKMREFAGSHAMKLGHLAISVIKSVTELAGERANSLPTVGQSQQPVSAPGPDQ